MSYTRFGEFMRIKRIKNHEVMANTAELLSVSVPFVSAVENGKKNVPDEWFDILVRHYNLNEGERNELAQAIEESKTQIKFNLSNAKEFQRRVALQFQRSFNDLDEETANALIELFNKKVDS